MIDKMDSVGHSPRSCLVTGGPPEKVIELAESLKPSMIQLHYNETLQDTIIITDRLRKLNIDIIKTIPPSKENRISQFATADIEKIVKLLCDTGVYALLVDSRTPANAPGSGLLLDIDLCSQIIRLSSKPVIIAGGINAGNVSGIISRTGSDFIDVMTGIEKEPGIKDADMLSNLMKAINK
jgi:phosphoribosylanthranilate isomerase